MSALLVIYLTGIISCSVLAAAVFVLGRRPPQAAEKAALCVLGAALKELEHLTIGPSVKIEFSLRSSYLYNQDIAGKFSQIGIRRTEIGTYLLSVECDHIFFRAVH